MARNWLLWCVFVVMALVVKFSQGDDGNRQFVIGRKFVVGRAFVVKSGPVVPVDVPAPHDSNKELPFPMVPSQPIQSPVQANSTVPDGYRMECNGGQCRLVPVDTVQSWQYRYRLFGRR